MSEITLTDENFSSEVLDSNKPVLVDFWASWCMPCKMLGPIIEEVAVEFGDKVKVCKLNVDEAGETASKYSIMSIPAVFIFKSGEAVERLIGLRQK
ncbi:MAG: thioredoxin, partial [Patescibacteria group bacterium]|nr:thioredoxin [Patescibacteria group bacterium]